MEKNKLEKLCINTIRTLGMDMVEKAQSGHPGLPMGASDIAYVLWTDFLRYNPKNSSWANRDRFVLSAGHGCALLYSMLHLTGFDLSMDELKKFRQWGSKTPGHPEYGHTIGVEATTGPLGQGFAMGVGMGIAQAFLAEYFNKKDHSIVDYRIYVICSDGDLMEGISSEAASIAGHLNLGNLIYIYLDNQISIEGSTDIAFTEDRTARFRSHNWQVIEVDGYNTGQIREAITEAQKEKKKPTLIRAKTHIGFGSPNKQDTAAAHGEPLGEREVRLVKERLGFPPDKSFYIPDEVKKFFKELTIEKAKEEEKWNELFRSYKKKFSDLAKEFTSRKNMDFKSVPVFPAEKGMSTRDASGQVLNYLASQLPFFVGGSADLAPSTKTLLKGFCSFGPNQYGCPNFHFGVREHAMGAIVNGIALQGNLIPYGSTFLTFSDYMRGSIRLAALMDVPSIFIFTHDSIGLGEDGPTHQPVEHLMSLRAVPNLTVIRPADANETAQALRLIVKRGKPAVLVLSRQKLPVLDVEQFPVADGVEKGAYILKEGTGTPEVIIIATGSEVSLALSAYEKLSKNGIKIRIVSMPSWELFEEQPEEYQEQMLPAKIKLRLAIEAGTTLGWQRWIGDKGAMIGIDRFGASAPGDIVMDKFGFNTSNVIQKVKELINKR
ncbi:MAG: transketolase [Spirochaetes bacterium]|nr:transketolase [Spirochaetota bacterium]